MPNIECVRIERITIRVGNALIELTPAEARQLMGELIALFNQPTVYAPTIAPIIVVPAPIQPVWSVTVSSTNGEYETLSPVSMMGDVG